MKLINQTAPLASNIVKHPELARTFEAIAEGGHDGYYKGRIAQGQSSLSLQLIAIANRCSDRRPGTVPRRSHDDGRSGRMPG